jgi:hypothetical protein
MSVASLVRIGVQGFARLGDEVEELLPVPEDQVGRVAAKSSAKNSS